MRYFMFGTDTYALNENGELEKVAEVDSSVDDISYLAAPTWMSIQDVGKMLGVNWFSVWRWVRDKKLVATKVDRSWRIQPASLDAFLASRSNQR